MRSGVRGEEARPGAEAWIPDTVDLASLHEAMPECRGCELYRDATQVVPGSGAADATVMVVGEQPGDREDRAGEPFVGPAGRLLDGALEEAGLPRESVFATNAVKHFRWEPGRNGKRLHKGPSRVHVTACGPWLVAEVDAVRPRGIVLLGATAGTAVYGPKFRVGTSRGRRLDWPDDTVPLLLRATQSPPDWVVVTAHPSSVLRSRDRDRDREALVADLALASRLLGSE
jgi:uracil-DNA glycosylase family protein